MIDSLTLKSVPKNCLPWAAKVDYFSRNPVTQFKPGLNILFGGNGSGKSTVLQLLGLHLAAVQGGASVVTQSWIQDVLGFSRVCELPCDVVHDGQPVMFFDARAKEGHIGGSFDDDFFDLGLANTLARGSTGQLGLQRLHRLLSVLAPETPPAADPKPAPKKRGKAAAKTAPSSAVPKAGGFPSEVVWKVPRKWLEDSQPAKLALLDGLLAAQRPVGPKTLLLDEPESGFSLPWQDKLWANLLGKVDPEKFQLIVATHSPFALGLPGANYIEMTPGSVMEAKVAIASLTKRILAGEGF